MAAGEVTADTHDEPQPPSEESSSGQPAPGEVQHPVSDAAHGHSAAVEPGGRVSVARQVLPQPSRVPFSTVALSRLDEALTLASRDTGLRFTIYLGELGGNTRQRAEQLHDTLGPAAANAVLVAVSPGECVVEIVTGAESRARLPDRACKLGVMTMIASFKEGDLINGLIAGLRMMVDQAGPRQR